MPTGSEVPLTGYHHPMDHMAQAAAQQAAAHRQAMYFNHTGSGRAGPARAQVGIPGGGMIEIVAPKHYDAASNTPRARVESPMHARQRRFEWSEEEHGVRALPRIRVDPLPQTLPRTRPLQPPKGSSTVGNAVPLPASAPQESSLSARHPHPGFSCPAPLPPPKLSGPRRAGAAAPGRSAQAERLTSSVAAATDDRSLPSANTDASTTVEAVGNLEAATQVVTEWLQHQHPVPAEVTAAVAQLSAGRMSAAVADAGDTPSSDELRKSEALLHARAAEGIATASERAALRLVDALQAELESVKNDRDGLQLLNVALRDELGTRELRTARMRDWCSTVARAVAELSRRVAWAGPAVWEAAEVRQLWRTTELLQSSTGKGSDRHVNKRSEQWLSEVQHQCCFALEEAQRMIESLHGAYIGNTADLDHIATLQQEVVQIKLEMERQEATSNGAEEQRQKTLDARWKECQQQERALSLKIFRAQSNKSNEQTTKVATSGRSERELRKQLEEVQAQLAAVSGRSTPCFPLLDLFLKILCLRVIGLDSTASYQLPKYRCNAATK